MVGPKASVLTPCVTRTMRVLAQAAGATSPTTSLWTLLLGVIWLLPQAALAQAPAGGPIQQAGFRQHADGHIAHLLHPQPLAPCYNGCCPETTYEYVPPPEHSGAHLAALGEGFRSMWYRLEYLNWTVKPPGDYPLGASLATGNEEEPFPAVDGIQNGSAVQPNAREFDLKKNNGLRFTIGAPTRVGDFEAAVFILDQADSAIVQDPILRFDLPPLNPVVPPMPDRPNFFAATILTVDGQPSDTTMLLYDQGYQASLKTDIFGTEANFVFNPLTPNQPLLIRPLVGFQYVNVRENFLIAGADERDAMDPTDPTATVIFNHRIDARARNNVFAPQIGVRAEFVQEWFSIGVTPKFLLGLNRRQDTLRTAQILDLMDSSFEEEQATEFSPGFDLKVDARVHLNEHFSIFAGYQLYVLSNISRPINNINYDTVGGTQANINLNTLKQHQFWFDGVTVGGELRFH